MFNGTNVSLKAVLWKVMNNPLAADLTYDLAAEYAIEGIKLIGAPLSLVNIVSPPIQLQSHKAALPINIVDLKQVRYMVSSDDDNACKIALTRATDSFHNSCSQKDCDSTYIAQQGIITTGFKDGFIEVAYEALPIDKDGFPLIPNNVKVLLAIEFYILERFLFPLYTIGKITDKAYHVISQKKDWYMGAANTNMQIQSYDHVESIMNGINRIIINSNAHSNFFKGMDKKERIKKYN